MTFDDDALCLETPAGRVWRTCKSLGMDWPPPERVIMNEVPYVRDSYSSITDEQRENMTNVFRGARYIPRLNA